MKINSIKVNSFSRDEYTADQTPEKNNLGGKPLLIKGPNKSGKSLTFAAIAHVILSGESPIDVYIGGGTDVSIGFTDESKMYRGAPKRQYKVIEEEGDQPVEKIYKTDEADEKLRARTGPVDIVRNHFLPAETRLLPLERLSGRDRTDVVLSAIDRSAKLELERKIEELNELEKEETRIKDKFQPLNKDKSRLSYQVSQHESQKSDWESIVDLSESGRLREIQERLDEKTGIKDELNQLSKRKRGLTRKITSKKNDIDALKRYENSVEEIIAEAITEFVCPVCDGKVDTDTAKHRMSHGNCPFCDENRSAAQVKQHIQEQKAEAKGRPGKLSTEIAEHKTELSEVESRIEELEKELPAISELNSFAVHELEKTSSIEELEKKAESELAKVSENLEGYKENLARIESEIKETESEVEQVTARQNEIEGKIEELRERSFDERFSAFQETLNKHFTNIGGEVGEASTVQFDKESGEITLLSENSEPRQYTQRSELSGSEIELLNISFALSLNDHATESTMVNWKVLFLDEPFSNLDSEITETALDYLLEIPQQVVLTSSNENVASRFSEHDTLQLSRNNTQAQLTRFE